MRIHKEGFRIIIITFLVLFTLNYIWTYIFGVNMMTWIFYSCSFLFFVAIVAFFRVPSRHITINDNAVVSPADGKVVVIEKIIDEEFFKDERIQVSIFMSPINVHINSYPISGTIEHVAYYEGNYFYAKHPKSSDLNEHTTVVIKKDESQSVLFQQIAGALARRIVCYSQEGEQAEQSHEMGIIKFGSRVDLLLPVDADIQIKLHQKVKGKQTVLAYLQNSIC